MLRRQSCKKCGVRDGLSFHVPDRLWAAVVPKQFVSKVLCLACFDKFAAQRGVEYHRSLRVVYFVGDQASFELRVSRCAKGTPFRDFVKSLP
jgi:cation diffusion facilitator CzcD-associated flavoprotein CzcO